MLWCDSRGVPSSANVILILLVCLLIIYMLYVQITMLDIERPVLYFKCSLSLDCRAFQSLSET